VVRDETVTAVAEPSLDLQQSRPPRSMGGARSFWVGGFVVFLSCEFGVTPKNQPFPIPASTRTGINPAFVRFWLAIPSLFFGAACSCIRAFSNSQYLDSLDSSSSFPRFVHPWGWKSAFPAACHFRRCPRSILFQRRAPDELTSPPLSRRSRCCEADGFARRLGQRVEGACLLDEKA